MNTISIRDAYWSFADAAGVMLYPEDVKALEDWSRFAQETNDAMHRIGAYRAILRKLCGDCGIFFSDGEIDSLCRALCFGSGCLGEDPLVTLLTRATANISLYYKQRHYK